MPTLSSHSVVFLAAAIFAMLVFSQDARLSPALYEPVSVTITGLDQPLLDRVSVVRLDLRARESPLLRRTGDATWRLPDFVACRGLRLEVPTHDADRIEDVHVAIGSRLFSLDPHRLGGWKRHDVDATRIFEMDESIALPRSRISWFRPVINWAGDARYATRLALATGCALAILASLMLALRVVGSIGVRLNIVSRDQWRPLASATLWMAALAGPPLFLLRRNAELYFGGTRGLVADTFYSTIENSFYGRVYLADQIRITFVSILAGVAVFALVLYRYVRRRALPTLVPAIAVLTILVLTSIALILQHALFDTVYLTGRTALFYVPLYVLFATLLCDAMVALGGVAKAIAMALIVVALSLASYHFVTTANLRFAWDWRSDASTRMMMEDLEQVLDEAPRSSKVVLGVDSAYLPVAVYYARRLTRHAVEIVSLPTTAPSDYQYIEESRRGRSSVIRRYSRTGTALVRTSQVP